eukprot:COSAG01_NODE_41421_length_451_cov_6.196023_1_plen_35_part_10
MVLLCLLLVQKKATALTGVASFDSATQVRTIKWSN